jgi:hypothetical protein
MHSNCVMNSSQLLPFLDTPSGKTSLYPHYRKSLNAAGGSVFFQLPHPPKLLVDDPKSPVHGPPVPTHCICLPPQGKIEVYERMLA